MQEPLYVVLFEDGDRRPSAERESHRRRRKGKRRRRRTRGVPELEHELVATKEYLQALDRGARADQRRAGAANEELVSGNEELQSMNEELETAKEELQSTNEELTTVNDELHSRNQEVSQVNSDLLNLLDTVDIPIVILDRERRIRRFTPKARSILNVRPVRRRAAARRHQAERRRPRSRQQVAEVIDDDGDDGVRGPGPRRALVPDADPPLPGRRDNKIDGAILSLVDIDALKHHLADAEWARDYALDIVEAVQVPLVVLDEELRVLSANQAFYGTFGTTEASIKARPLFEVDGGQWNLPALRAPLEHMLSTQLWAADLEIENDFPRIGRRMLRVSACAVHSRANVPMILLALEDITARRQAEDERAELLTRAEAAKEEAEHANAAKDEFLAMLSHELRTPLAAMLHGRRCCAAASSTWPGCSAWATPSSATRGCRCS